MTNSKSPLESNYNWKVWTQDSKDLVKKGKDQRDQALENLGL
jgi:hypothetical protein